MKIAFCMIGLNCLGEAKERLNEMAPYVDRMIYIDGGSIDDTIVYMRNRDDVELYIHKWQDDFAAQRNYYLKYANEKSKADWIITADTDESFSLELRKNLRDIIKEAESSGRNQIDIRCRRVWMKGENRVRELLDSFWKPLIFKNELGINYIDELRESLINPTGWESAKISDPYLYEHIKQERIIWKRGARNFIICGGSNHLLRDSNPHYLEFKKALGADGHALDSIELNKLMINGELGSNTTQWIIDHRNIDEKIGNTGSEEGCSEMREMYKTYFRLYHPELEPEEFRDEVIKGNK